MLTCASHHKLVHFFDILTSKNSPRPPIFYTFDFEMRFAPQSCALLSTSQLPKALQTRGALCILHLKLPKVFEHEALFTFRIEMCATTASNFSSLISPYGSAPAALASLLFDSPGPQTLEKHRFATFLPLRALHLPSSDSFPFLIFFLLPFSSLTLPTPAFPSVHIVGTLTSKLPSII